MAKPKPTASALLEYYSKFLRYKTNTPCKDPQADNQCAIRLSIALEGLEPGFLDDFQPANRVHRDRITCPNLPPHVLGAAELGVYLTAQWGLPYGYHGRHKKLARSVLAHRPGVLWFEHCYIKHGVPSDHIDAWTGFHYMNEVLHVGAGGDRSSSDDLFAKSAGAIRFFPLLPS
jgi:hypothetical protein